MVLYLCADLVWGTRIKSTGDALGVPCRPARTPDMLRARLADSPVRGLIVDLDAGDAAIEVIAAARNARPASARAGPPSPPGLFILAFGPHVAADRFEAARRAGADVVLARGALDRRLPDVLTALALGGAGLREPRSPTSAPAPPEPPTGASTPSR